MPDTAPGLDEKLLAADLSDRSPAGRAYRRALERGLPVTPQDIASILLVAFASAGERPGLAETERALLRAKFIEDQARELAAGWREESTHGSGPEDIATASCAARLENILSAAGSPPPVDHLAEALSHLTAFRAECEAGRV
jgi:hypothetical protein